MMTTLRSRVDKLEKSIPIKNSLVDLTIEELNEKLFLLCQRMFGRGIEPSLEILLTNPKCREFYKGRTPWVMNCNHRLCVFLKFKQIILKLEIPNKMWIESIFNLGWSNKDIDPADIDLLLNELKGIDLGEETSWLQGYLEYSGKS